MNTPLRVLLVEDDANDSELLQIRLRRAGFDAVVTRVQTVEAFSAALDGPDWDLIIADHSMPVFDAPRALAVLKEKRLDIPFVVMSGTIADSMAIEMMRAGANDFIAKSDAARLEPVIRRELHEAENRRARKRAEVEREEVLARLEVANRVKDEILAMLGHELRNPLAPIVTALQLLKGQRGGLFDREHAIIERQVQHLVRLVDDLLDVARITKGNLELTLRTVELREAIVEAVETTTPLFEQRKHRFRLEAPPCGLLVDIDESRLVQVVRNLLTNAARYTLPGGEISLSAAAEQGEVVIRVKDNGIGIEARMLPRIFDLFVEGERAIDRKVGGLGLGLSLVRTIITLHGGSVTAESEGPGRGSEFTIRLPAAAQVALAMPRLQPPTGAGQPHPEGTRVLLVDDNGDALELLGELFRESGYEVEMALDGPTGLRLLDRFLPAVMVLDIGLPVMDGYELARQIRARPEHVTSLLIALTGYGQSSDRDRALQAGFNLHMVKPVDFSELLDAMQTFSAAQYS